MFQRITFALAFGVCGVLFADAALAQTGGLGIYPGRVELEIQPGQEKTIAFQIEAPASDQPVRGRLTLSLTDWTINPDATTVYLDPGNLPDSASRWVIFSPSAINIASGESHQVRVTTRVPETTQPGVYRSAIFVQERPPAAPPVPGQHVVYFRFRYAFTLYVIVGPVAGKGKLIDARLDPQGRGVTYQLKNEGSRHMRPYVSWTIRDASQKEVVSVKREEFTVLLPSSSVQKPFFFEPDLPPGQYELVAQVDFNDGGPIQSLRRTVEIPDSQRVADISTTEEVRGGKNE